LIVHKLLLHLKYFKITYNVIRFYSNGVSIKKRRETGESPKSKIERFLTRTLLTIDF